MKRFFSIPLSLALALSFGARLAHAGDPAAAEALFREARSLMEKGEVEAACSKFGDSQRLDPSSGTLLNLADCHAKEGKSATAWAEFLEAERLARNQGKALHQEEASRRARALEAELSYVTIRVEEPSAGMEVKRGEAVVPSASFGSPLPVDPGNVVVSATSPGFRPFSTSIAVSPREKKIVVVPKLVADSATAAVPSERPPVVTTAPTPASPPAERHTGPGAGPWITGGVGLAALGIGGLFGALALSSNSDAKAACPTQKNCPKKAVEAADARDTQANVANVAVGVGLVGLVVAGGWFLLSSGGDDTPSAEMLRVRVVERPDGVDVRAEGRF